MEISIVRWGLRGTVLGLAALLGLGACGKDDGTDAGKDLVGELVQGDQLGLDAAQDTLETDLAGSDLTPEDTLTPVDATGLDHSADLPTDTVDSDVAGLGACTNDEDQGLLQTDREAIDLKVKQCTLTCYSGRSPESCIVFCIKEVHGLTNKCALCFAQQGLCGLTNCMGQCSMGPDSEACLGCQAQYCAPAFLACSGLAPQG
jgi:hypothetical protein